MANQDYISRPPPKKKKKPLGGRKTSNKTQTSPFKSKVIILIVIILIASFTQALWSLKTAPGTKKPLIEPIENTKKEIKTPDNATPLPELPKERWTYHEELENKVIEAGTYEIKDKGPYKMQCGSFTTAPQAERLKAMIAFAGLEAQVQRVTGTNGTWHKVILGPYPRKRIAEKDKHRLNRSKIYGCQIWGWR
ncbi:MAG: SPOR domain-containing protein [Colwellia sp.]